MLHVISVLYVYPSDRITAQGLLDRYSTVTPWARAMREHGVEVTVLLRFREDVTLRESGICYDFRTDWFGPWLRYWQIPGSFHSAIQTACRKSYSNGAATIVHVHGLFLSLIHI